MDRQALPLGESAGSWLLPPPSQLSRAGTGKLALLLLLPPAPPNLLQQAAREVRNTCAARGATSTRGGQRLCSTERHGGTKPLSAQRDLPRHRSAPKSCTRCLLPTAQLGYRPRHQQLLCFEVRPQPRRHIASACLTAVPKCCLSRQGRPPCLWTHFWAHLLLQAKPATLPVPSAAVLCRGEMRSSKNCAVSLEVNSD